MTGPVHAGRVAACLEPERSPAAGPRAVPVDPAAKLVIDDLFDRLRAIHSGWRQAWPTEAELAAAKREWLAAFVAAGIRQIEQIHYGLRVARQNASPWIPAPGEFIAWCFDPAAFGLPPLERAYAEVMRNTHPAQVADARWSADALYHAAVASGFSTLQALPREAGLRLFERHYVAVCRRLARGEVLAAAPVAALPAPARKSAPEVGRAALSALRARLGRSA